MSAVPDEPDDNVEDIRAHQFRRTHPGLTYLPGAPDPNPNMIYGPRVRRPGEVPDITLVEFLRARLDERAQAAEMYEEDADRYRWTLADVEAKRRIVDQYTICLREYDTAGADALGIALCLLALPDADHPDYRGEDWAP